MNDMGYRWDVESTSGDVGREQDRMFMRLEATPMSLLSSRQHLGGHAPVKILEALTLFELRVKRESWQAE